MDVSVITAFSAALAAGGIAIVVAISARSLTQWLFVAGMTLLAAESLLVGLTCDAVVPQAAAYWQQWRLVVLALIPGTWLAFSKGYALQNKRELVAQGWWFWPAALILPASLGLAFFPWLMFAVGESAAGSEWAIVLGPAGVVLNLWVLLGTILVLMTLERTYRSAVGTMRWRIKFMVLGLGVLFVVRAFTASQVVLFKSLNLSLQTVDSTGLLIACLLIGRTLFRTGHFETGIYPSHSLLHGSFTVLLAGAYLLVLGVVAKLTARLGGESAFELKAFLILVSLALLAAALLSERVRLLTRIFISRHFHRPLHDYRAIWRTFVERNARCTDQKTLCASITTLVSEIFQALSVSLWVFNARKDTLSLAASTSLSEPRTDGAIIDGLDAAEVARGLGVISEPINLDTSKESWAAVLRRWHPTQFPDAGGNRLCIPISGGGDLLGFILVADRVGGIQFSMQDFELLKALSDQSAASVLSIQLTDRLSQARQLEAFQAMSAFFVHDLKNTASTLALMLKNFPLHYENPSFRDDALRGMSKTLTHLNELIERLNILRHDLEVKATECDLSQLVIDALTAHEAAEGARFITTFGIIPKVRVDPGQIGKVITNLVLNAKQAVGNDGQIRIQTSRRNGWVVLEVEDNGCGMSPEFIRNSLFRPFQTTKKSGLGIGMFHCKLIVEAHRGHIEVQSLQNKGTLFRVLLPA